MTSELLFAPYAPESMAPDQCIGAKFDRLLEAFELKKSVENRRVVIKMHLGGGNGFSTIHPFFVRKLVKALKAAGAESIFITDLKRDVAKTVGALKGRRWVADAEHGLQKVYYQI